MKPRYGDHVLYTREDTIDGEVRINEAVLRARSFLEPHEAYGKPHHQGWSRVIEYILTFSSRKVQHHATRLSTNSHEDG